MALALVSSTQISVVSIPAVAFFYNWRLLVLSFHLLFLSFLYLFPLFPRSIWKTRARNLAGKQGCCAFAAAWRRAPVSKRQAYQRDGARERHSTGEQEKRKAKREEKREKRITISHLSHFSLSRDHPLPSTRAVGSSLYILHVSWYCYGRLCNVPDAPFLLAAIPPPPKLA